MQNPADFDRTNNDHFENMPNEAPGRVYYDEYTGREYYVPYPEEQINYPPYSPQRKRNRWFAPLMVILGAVAVFLIVFLIIKLQDKKNAQVEYDNQTGLFSNTFSQETESTPIPDSFTQSNDDLLATLRAMEVERTQESLEQTLAVLSLPSETPPPTPTKQRNCSPSSYSTNDSVWADVRMSLLSDTSENASHIGTVRENDILWIIGEAKCVNGDNLLYVQTTHEEKGWVKETNNGTPQVSRVRTEYVCNNRLPTRFRQGMTGKVVEMPDFPNNVYDSYSKTENWSFRINYGTRFTVLEDPVCYDGTVFIKIQTSNGDSGWTRESGSYKRSTDYYYLAPTR